MGFELSGHRFTVHVMDPGVAVVGLEGEDPGAEAILAFAHHTSCAAVRGALWAAQRPGRLSALESRLTHTRPARGPLEAAAIVERELAVDLAHDIRRNGSAETRVAVAVVDARGETVAFGSFDFKVTTGEEDGADAEPNDGDQCPRPFSFSTLARNIAN